MDIAKLFPETREILDAIKESDIKLAIASRSPTPDVAKTFLKEIGNPHTFHPHTCVLNSCTDSKCRRMSTRMNFLCVMRHVYCAGILNGYFEGMVIVPYVNKDRKHFPDLRQKLGIEFEDMLFFDDEQLQYRVVSLTAECLLQAYCLTQHVEN